MIRQVMDHLNTADKQLLMVAFEAGTEQIIELVDSHFIGVNISDMGRYDVLERKGEWSYGRIVRRP